MRKTILVSIIMCLLMASCQGDKAVIIQKVIISTPKPGDKSITPNSTNKDPGQTIPNSNLSSTPPGTSNPGAESSTTTPGGTPNPSGAPSSTTPQTGVTGIIPKFDHVVLIFLENEDYSAVIGNSELPNLNALAKKYVLLSNYFAVSHPSLPNYISIMSGSTQGISSDCTTCFVDAPNLADLIEASGRTWKSYMENMPSDCFIGDKRPYAQKHNPLLYFNSIRLNATRCDKSIVPLTQLDGDLSSNQLPNFSFIMPNLCNSGHDCGMNVADGWVGNMVDRLTSSPALGKNSMILIVFDEGDSSNRASCCDLGARGGGQVAAILISPLAKPGFTDTTAYDHYSVLKTILSAWDLPLLGMTKNAATLPIIGPWQ